MKKKLGLYGIWLFVCLAVFSSHAVGILLVGTERLGGSLFNFSDVFLVYVLPPFAVLYGVLSYLTTRSVLFSQLVLSAVSVVLYPLIHAGIFGYSPTYNLWLLSLIYVGISLVCSLITAGICKIVKRAATNMRRE